VLFVVDLSYTDCLKGIEKNSSGGVGGAQKRTGLSTRGQNLSTSQAKFEEHERSAEETVD
jgi:hypothetical protein